MAENISPEILDGMRDLYWWYRAEVILLSLVLLSMCFTGLPDSEERGLMLH